jgi:hypothetical protein
MSSNTSSTKVDIPRWDGTRDSYATYSFKIKALCSVLKCSDALNPTKMTKVEAVTFKQADNYHTDVNHIMSNITIIS